MDQASICHFVLSCGMLGALGSAAAAADCNGNGVHDAREIEDGASRDCNSNGVPDECDIAADPFGFTPAWRIELGYQTVGGGVGDMDGDGLADVVTIEPDRVRVFRNGRGGRFDRPVDTIVPLLAERLEDRDQGDGSRLDDQPPGLSLMDLDGDRDADAVVAGTFEILIFLNAGKGSLDLAERIPHGNEPDFVTAADLSGDGFPDLVTANAFDGSLSDTVSILLSDGGGRFSPARNYAAGRVRGPAVAADVDGDGDLDVGVVDLASGALILLKNAGKGISFVDVRVPFLGPEADVDASVSLFASDWDEDGDVDWLAGQDGTDAIVFLKNDGSGSAGELGTLELPQHEGPFLVDDLDLDGAADLVTFGRGEESIVIFRGLGKGLLGQRLVARNDSRWQDYSGLRAIDMDADGDRDLVSLHWLDWEHIDGSLDAWARVLLNHGGADCNGNGTLDSCEPDCNASGWPDDCDVRFAGAGDCDGDLIPDACEALDANGNGVSDACELEDGSASDCNQNGVPDDADLRPKLAFEAAQKDPSYVKAVASADFDGDQDLDVVASLAWPSELRIYEGVGGRGFHSTACSFEAAWDRLLPMDLDQDGDLDIAADGFDLAGLGLLLNDGKGTFTRSATISFPAGETCSSDALAASDFDGDGLTDVALVCERGLFLLPGRTNGSLAPLVRVLAAGGPTENDSDVVAFDCDGDSDMDLATGAGRLFVNRGGGMFEVGAHFPVEAKVEEQQRRRIAAADFDGDLDIDLMTGLLAVNKGSGTFASGQDLGPAPELVVADLDRNGAADVLLPFSGALHVNTGDGTFHPASTSLRLPEYGPFEAADLDADGAVDLIAGDGGFAVHWGLGDGTFGLPRVVSEMRACSLEFTTVQLADLDGDSDLDLVNSCVRGVLTERFNEGGELGQAVVPGIHGIADAADMDGDGAVDLVVAQETSFVVLFNDGRGAFPSRADVELGAKLVQEWIDGGTIWTADFNGDGSKDFLAFLRGNSGESLQLYAGSRERSFEPSAMVPLGRDNPFLMGDFDGDEDVDLLASRGETLVLWDNDGTGNLSRGWPSEAGFRLLPFAAASADFDGDGFVDLVLERCKMENCLGDFCACTPSLHVFRNLGARDLKETAAREMDYQGYDIEVVDVDLDGDVDFLVPATERCDDIQCESYSNYVQVFLNDGKGSFALWGAVEAVPRPMSVAAGDLDGDALPDLAVKSGESDEVALVFNRTVLPTIADADLNGIPDSCEARFQRGDWNADGAANLSDAVGILGHLFLGLDTVPCEKAGDSNDDGRLDLTDPIRLLMHLFLGAPAPPVPWAACGSDETPDALACETQTRCA